MKQYLKIILCAGLIAFATDCQGQFFYEFGGQGGLSISTQKWKYEGVVSQNEYKRGYRLGLTGSAFFDTRFSDRWRMQIGIGGNQKGFKETIRFNSTGVKGEQELTTNNWMAYGHYWLGFKYYVIAKPKKLYLIATMRVDVDGGKHAHEIYQAHFNRFDAWYPGIAYGAGFSFPIGKIQGFGEFLHNPDVFPAFSDGSLSIYHNAFEIKFGILLPGKWVKRKINPNYGSSKTDTE